MGNPHGNFLPKCQCDFLKETLARLSHVLKTSDDDIPFWLDTLCVPIQQPFRSKAIARMRETYTGASAVLALDNDLINYSGPDLQFRLRVELPDWTSRLWTYQEASLAGATDTYLVFRDRLIALHELSRRGAHNKFERPEKYFDDTTSADLLSETFLHMSSDLAFDGVKGILTAAHTLHGRQTQHPEDEPICLAILFNVETEYLPWNPSLADVLQYVDPLPADIIFTPGPRCTTPGFRWAPLTFLNQFQMKYDPVQSVARVMPRGICVTKPMAHLAAPFYIDPNRTDQIIEIQFEDCASKSSESKILLSYIEHAPSTLDGEVEEVQNGVLVFERISHKPAWCRALLLSHVEVKDGLTYGRRRALMMVVGLTDLDYGAHRPSCTQSIRANIWKKYEDIYTCAEEICID